MAIPSITMIPSGYKAEKVYSVLPTNGDGDLFFDRNTPATRVNKNGLIEQVGTDIPTLDYSDGSCPSLLSERYSLNLAGYSEDFSQGWIKNNSTVTTNQTTSPRGDLTADKFIATATNQPRVERSFTIPTSNKTYTFSVFVKKISTPYVAIGLFNGSTNIGTIFNLDTKSVVSSDSESSSIKELSNGWFRISMTQTVLSTDTFNYWKILNTNGSNAFVGVIGDETFIWGAQLEEQRYATSYIPTTTGSASRGADSASKDGLSSYISSTEGVLYSEIADFSDDFFGAISLSDGSLLNRIYIIYVNVSNIIQVKVDVGDVNQVVITQTLSDITSNTKVAFKYKANDFSLWINGTEYIGTPVNGGGVPSGLNRLGFDYGVVGDRFNGKVKDLRVYNTALTDLELQELTTI